MQLILAWKREKGLPPVEIAASNMIKMFNELFDFVPKLHTYSGLDYELVYLEQAPHGWKASYHERNEHEWALSLDYPFNVRRVCGNPGDEPLLAASRDLNVNPHTTLGKLSPHFALFSGDNAGTGLRIQIDGLGFCQLYEFQLGGRWAVSNRISAFRSLGIQPRPDPSQFAVKFALKGFPNELTGFKNIRQFSPGQRVVLSGGEISTDQVDVLSTWVNAQHWSRETSLEIGRQSILEELRSVNDLWETPVWTGLTGGRDTRALVSTLLSTDIDFHLRVRGRESSYDVKIARDLARIAKRPLKVENDAVLPPAAPKELLRKARQAALWQAGHQLPNLIKMFLSGKDRLDGGFTNLMGQHGEIGRGMYEIYLGLTPPSLSDDENERRLFDMFSANKLSVLQPAYRDRAREEFHIGYNLRANQYDLHGWRRLNFYGLTQQTRRYNSGGHYAQPGQVVTPFLNVDFIRASYCLPVEQLRLHPFHEYMVAKNYPAWSGVEYDQELIARDAKRRRTSIGAIAHRTRYYLTQLGAGRNAWTVPQGTDDYTPWRYWNTVGEEPLKSIIRNGGMWEKVFDVDKVSRDPHSVADELLLLSAIEDIYPD